ncbi:hypothetical protein G5714_004923 [Onychostoma macrolepis]|uniref:Uncharacterized protein n=1 Tax=Onychostoma macrolepis TaxID=369639 RepID=A0A7J6D635_9TELE|nr:hypothetical protein G5714_004923 [Onychostoma macrolepis]
MPERERAAPDVGHIKNNWIILKIHRQRPEGGSPDPASPPLTTGSSTGSSPCVSHQRPCGDTQSLGRGAVAGDRGMHLKLKDSRGQGVKHNLFEKVSVSHN